MKRETIDGLLSAAAQENPDGVAVVDRERRLTYAELDAQTSRMAHVLRSRGVKPGDRVGLWLEKSLEALIGLYGTLKAGATYVPIDPESPVKRAGFIIRDAGIGCLVSTPAKAADWPGLLEGGPTLRAIISPGEHVAPAGVELVPWSDVDDSPATAPTVEHDPDALAYVLYTSGSTGEPKGVMLSHRNGLHFVDWAARELKLQANDRLSSHAPLHFDLSTFDLFGAAWAAAPVVLVPREASVFPRELTKFIQEQGITVWYSVPSILTALVLRGDLGSADLSALRAIIFAGEVFPVKYLQALMDLLPHACYFNFYGPTETNVCTWYEVPRDRPLPESVPIGWPLPGVEARVEHEDGTPVASGEVGELLINGPTVMHGYWGDPERTARTLSSGGAERTYRTGDLVRADADGTLELIGRRDSQIKTRGYRVELGEIEAVLNALDVVLECAVVAIPDEAVTNRLKAFVVAREPLTAAGLAGACRQRLPAYMIPEEFEFREVLPKSSTGKIDRRQLKTSA